MKSVMSIDAMEKTYVEFGLLEETYDMLWKMATHGLINSKTWTGFCERCNGYQFDETETEVLDEKGQMRWVIDLSGYWKKL